MTENQWPEGSAREPLDQYGKRPASTSAEPETYVTKKETAKEEAGHVAGQAAGAARQVAQAARDEAGNVAAEAKSETRGLLHQAKAGLGSQAGAQQQKAADGIRTISGQLRTMADASEQQGAASELIRQAAERTSSVASWIEGKEPGALLNDLQAFARRKPGTFLLLAAGAGVVAGRLARGLQAGGPAPQAAAPPMPAQAPATAATAPPWGEEPVYREQVASPATYGETIYGEPARPAYSGTEAGGVPLVNPDDPYSEVRGAERQP